MKESTTPQRENPIINIIGFCLILVFAWIQDWKASDLIWSLWLGSLLIGYLTIAGTVLSVVILVTKAIRVGVEEKLMEKKHVYGLSAVTAVGALFFLGFFSLHYCGFHAGHAIFLSHFFPLSEIDLEKAGLSDAFMNPVLLLKIAVLEIAPIYLWFFLPALLIEWRKVVGPILAVLKFKPDNSGAKFTFDGMPKDLLSGPYRNVIKMHLLIFFFAGAHFLNLDNFLVYVVVYAVYFFPTSLLKKRDGSCDSPLTV